MVGVFAALGSGYQEARNQARNENTISGSLKASLRATRAALGAHASAGSYQYLRINAADEAMDSIQVTAYNGGLKTKAFERAARFRRRESLPDHAAHEIGQSADAGQWSKQGRLGFNRWMQSPWPAIRRGVHHSAK